MTFFAPAFGGRHHHRPHCPPPVHVHHRRSWNPFGWGRPRPTIVVRTPPIFVPRPAPIVVTTPSPAVRVPVVTYQPRMTPAAALIISGVFMAVIGACLAPASLGASLAIVGVGVGLVGIGVGLAIFGRGRG
jgi:hypothetical protein